MASKKTGIKTVKTKADKIFSKYIRLRDSDVYGIIKCITCGESVEWKHHAHAGHFVTRGRLSTRYDERNVNGQCIRCNCYGAGEQYKHGKAIDLKYGEGTAEELMAMPRDGFKFSVYEYEIMITQFTKLAEIEAKRVGVK